MLKAQNWKRLGRESVKKIGTPLFFMALIGWTAMTMGPLTSPSASTQFIRPTPYLEYFTFGYRDLVADLMWLRTIQDLDHCDHSPAPADSSGKSPGPGGAQREESPGSQQNPSGVSEGLCKESWAFKMVDKITDLSPQFRIIYATVPLLLWIVINDRDGALALSEKGLRYFPKDWPILYRTGSLYTLQEGQVLSPEEKARAADYFLRAQKNGGPDWLVNLAARLYSEAGKQDVIALILRDYEHSGLPEALLARLKAQLQKK